ncbi:TonB-dependent receptor [Parvularcula sp. ZS-1/3]|uniref:TonB-dependent receptor n=1 Tax=Parvularcula mediterranea TaxID=2732508 RepID=A0A7Y3RKW8_9PROT|nr:TonB-dependent receptor [Parvularcula mediterranea]NNU15964.1 TonB-dependent receptor [Parvularcula mediterranea]
MFRMNRKAALLCCAALPAIAISTGFAQETAVEEDGDVIVVRGIKKAIEDSLDAKKNSNSIVEAISAEDIGKLPDVSIADSLARLPGVTAQRVRGRAQQISIRGLGPAFSIALLNGREQVSANNNRGIEFDQFPSELIAQGLVYKSPDATLAATGIAGAVDLRTVRPLDYSSRRVNVSGRYVVNSEDEANPDFDRNGYRLFGSYIDQFADGTIGVSIGITDQSNPTQYTSRELKTNPFQIAIDPDNGLFYPSDNPRTGVVSRDFERTSYAGTLQWKPNDRFESTFDAFITETEDAGIFRGVETPIASWSGAQFEGTTGNGGFFADSATFSAVVPILRTDTESSESTIESYGWNTEYAVTDRFSIMLDVARSTMERTDLDYESYAGTGVARSGAQDTLTYNIDPDGEYSITSQIDYTDPGVVLLTDPGGWGQVGFTRSPNIEDELDQIRLEGEYDLEKGWLDSAVVGYLYTAREKSFQDTAAFIRAGTGFNTDREASIPQDAIVGQTDSGSIGLDIIAYDPSALIANGTYIVDPTPGNDGWTVEENIDTFYAMFNLDGELGGKPLRGNVGAQYVMTEQSSTGTLAGGNGGLQTVDYEYEDFLPSLNLALEVAENTFLRFAAAKLITRPRLDQLAANQSIGFNPLSCVDTDSDGFPDQVIDFDPPQLVCFNIGGGNATLEPFRSTQYDLAFEKYFGDASALSFAVFHKDLSDWVVSRNDFIDGTGTIQNFGDSGDLLATNPEVALTGINGPVNFADGSLTGFEATVRVGLGDVYEQLDGFGFSASYTYTDSELEADGVAIPIPGYSEEIWSGDVYYEKGGFRARLNARHRGDFRAEVTQFDGALIGSDQLGETVLDGQIGYEFNEGGPLGGWSFILEAYNLTDERIGDQNDIFTNNDPNNGDVVGTFPSRFEQYGTTYNFIVSKSF